MGNWAELMLFLYRSGWIRKEKYPRVPVEAEWCGLSSVACKDPEIGMFRLCLGNATDSFLHIMSAWNKDTEAMDTVQPLSSDCLPSSLSKSRSWLEKDLFPPLFILYLHFISISRVLQTHKMVLNSLAAEMMGRSAMLISKCPRLRCEVA